jgi:uncharacterized DUF497 family protein
VDVKITGIIWLEEIVEKLWHKHGVDQSEVKEVFRNAPYFRFVEKGDRKGEDVYSALGRADSGRYLIIFFIYKQDRQALVVSARKMEPVERRQYERR